MASLQTHLEQAESNEKSALADLADFPDWCVTKCFYAMLHYVEVYASYHNDSIESLYASPAISPHNKRKKYIDDISDKNDWDDLPIIYRKFYRASMKSRYLENINSSSVVHFKFGASYYIEQLQVFKDTLGISEIKLSLSALTTNKKTC